MTGSPHWYTSPDEAHEAAERLGKPLFLYCWQPADSCFIHPLNRNRDYCENRLLRHPAVAALLREKYVAAKIDLARYPDVAMRYGLPLAGASLSIADAAGPGIVRLVLRGEELLGSPAELVDTLGGFRSRIER